MSDAAFNLQTALYSALTGSTAVTGAGSTGTVNVYDHVPQNSSFPYIAIGEALDADWSSKTYDGQRHAVTLHIWSRYRGAKEIKQITSAVHTLLHNSNLSVTSHGLTLLQFDNAQYMTEADSMTRHGVIRYTALTHES